VAAKKVSNCSSFLLMYLHNGNPFDFDINKATAHIAVLLMNYVEHTYAGTQNNSGDDQLHLDIDCDNAVFAAIRNSGVYTIAASEETPIETDVGPDEEGAFSLGFDPLDGSSIIDANFSVGSIFGIWPGKGVLHRTGREQVASAVAVYGPRTTLLIALPAVSNGKGKDLVLEVTLVSNRAAWDLSRDDIVIQPDGKVFAPGNLRATNDNPQYDALVKHWISSRYTLRYSGGMVPDVYHIFAKSKGVFANVSSDKAKAKLRLLYEVAPLGLMVECAQGVTTHEFQDTSVLDIKIDDLDQRLGVCFGSANEVAIYKQFLFSSKTS
jgi:sedoheptulose-bisphosphatase